VADASVIVSEAVKRLTYVEVVKPVPVVPKVVRKRAEASTEFTAAPGTSQEEDRLNRFMGGIARVLNEQKKDEAKQPVRDVRAPNLQSHCEHKVKRKGVVVPVCRRSGCGASYPSLEPVEPCDGGTCEKCGKEVD